MQCPFCKEEILDGAIKCKHCGSALNNPSEAATVLSTPNISVNNTIVWILAFAPVIGEFSKGLIIGFIGNPFIYDKLWFVTLIMNIALCLADEKGLKKAGYDTAKMGSAWLIPVYLYKRAQVLKQNMAYFIVWIVTFALVLLDIL